MNNLLISKLAKSKTVDIKNDLDEAFKLAQNQFFTSAFLRQWRILEAISRELMLLYRTSKETKKIQKKLLSVLRKSKIESKTNNLSYQFENILFSSTAKHMENSCRNIDISTIKNALSDCEIDFDGKKIKFILSSELSKDDKKEENLIPLGVDRISIREKRNRLIHKNQSITADEYEQYLPFFQYYFDLISQIQEKSKNTNQIIGPDNDTNKNNLELESQ